MDEQDKRKEKDKGGQPHGQDEVVALRYDPDNDNAPVVVASGSGYVARKILEVAQQQDIPVVEDEALMGALRQLRLGAEIPPALFEVVAEVLLFVDALGRRKAKNEK